MGVAEKKQQNVVHEIVDDTQECMEHSHVADWGGRLDQRSVLLGDLVDVGQERGYAAYCYAAQQYVDVGWERTTKVQGMDD